MAWSGLGLHHLEDLVECLLAHALDGEECFAVRGEQQACAIEVEDDGPGVPADVAGRLFEPFFTTKGAKGTGLGLSLSREYLARYGATIDHAPAPGGGARFTVRVPHAARAAPQSNT